jgi:thermostable 8-oxoguanine DNA glycosylase
MKLKEHEKPRHADETKAKQFLETIDANRVKRYEEYFQTIKPVSDVDIFRRALFAFASVHTTWQLNCRLYEALYDLEWRTDDRLLLLRIAESGAGLHNNRFRYIRDFAQRYWAHPAWYLKQGYEDWTGYRDRLDKNIKGLGLAKTAFFSELVYFENTEIACMDVHLLKLMGIPAKQYRTNGASAKFTKWCEQTWTDLCKEVGVSPMTARAIYWDTKQGKADMRYWSYVLEQAPTSLCGGQLPLFPIEQLLSLTRIPSDPARRTRD